MYALLGLFLMVPAAGFLAAFMLLLMLPLAILDARVISDMWLWFAVPLFGVKPISWAGAFCLNLLVQAFVMKPSAPANADKTKDLKANCLAFLGRYATLALAILINWFVAYIAHLYLKL